MSQLSLFVESKSFTGSRYWIEKLSCLLKDKRFDGSAKKAWKVLRRTEFPRLFMAMYLANKKWIIDELNKQ